MKPHSLPTSSRTTTVASTVLALVAFPFKRETLPIDKRGLVIACSPRVGRLAELMSDTLKQPPIMNEQGVMVWEGRLYFEGEEVPEDALRRSAWREKLFWDGTWRVPTTDEWERIRRGKSPWR